jgi:hypothetical protein
MTPHDRENLDFLLNASPEALAAWHGSVTGDDIEYAQELLDQFARELNARARELRVEAELGLMSEYSQARAILKQF